MLAGDSGWNFYWLSVARIMEKFSVFSADEIVRVCFECSRTERSADDRDLK